MRWLHCSDFHFGKDRYAEEKLAGRIVEHVKEQVAAGFVPDLIFITGDIANGGTKPQYNSFRDEFLAPLRTALGGKEWKGTILAVPGNHDADRSKASGFDRQAPLKNNSRFFDPNRAGKGERDILTARFKAYWQGAVADFPGDWISQPDGAYAETFTFGKLKVGVAGINTAWLSKDEHDRYNLSPGLPLVEAALEKLSDCHVRFVLGHHPLAWIQEDQAQRLRALFGKHRVIYLHGHMHKADAVAVDGSGHQFLTIQAGAAFQARDGEIWRNGLLWGQLALDDKQLLLSPRIWNPQHYDWPVESDRFPVIRRAEQPDWWSYPLPINPAFAEISAQGGWNPPVGWDVLDRPYLDDQRREITTDEADRFFDGGEPDWPLALSPLLPRRQLVSQLADELGSYQSSERPLLMLLTGPGGEGKSMLLRQVLVQSVEQNPAMRVLWHSDESALLSESALLALPTGPWIIATDTADLLANRLFELMQAARKNKRCDIRFLLCARETDWRAAGAEKHEWEKHSDFRLKSLSGLQPEDALQIVRAWAKFDGDEAPAEALQEKADALMDAARREAAISEGALLGGVLEIRHGKALRGHVARLMDRLAEYRLESGGTLLDAFTYIAVMHTEGLDYLTRPVLAAALHCTERELGQQVIVPLGKEAAANGGSVLLTRHRRIALEAVDILKNDLGEDVASRVEQLVLAALKAFHEGIYVPSLANWKFKLADHFLSKKPTIAIRLAQAVYGNDIYDGKSAVNLARIYRECQAPETGAQLLANFPRDTGAERGLWFEWGTCEGTAGEQAVGVLLDGWSICDQAASTPPDTKQAKASLAGLGVALGELHALYLDPSLLNARAAVAWLGLQLPALDGKTRSYFERYQRETSEAGVAIRDTRQALNLLPEAMQAAWELSGQPARLLDRGITADAMTFKGLARLFGFQD